MRRICVVVTARPSYARIKTALLELQKLPGIELQVVAAASALVRQYGQVVDLIRADGLPVVAEVPCVVEGGGTREGAISTGLLTAQLATLFSNLRPSIVVTIADRHETLATAIAASYQHIPLWHVQGGEVSGSIDDKVRNAVTQLADVHLVATVRARERVLALRPGATVHVTGCPSIDLAAQALREGPLPGHDVVVLQHPVTGEAGDAAAQICETIEALKGMDVLWFWPGEDAGHEAMSKELRMAGLAVPLSAQHPVRNMEPVTFLRTLLGSGVLVGNSSVGIRECSFMGVPVVNIGTRQRGRERGPNVIDVVPHADAIRDAVQEVRSWPRMGVSIYGDGLAGGYIADLLAATPKEQAA